MWKTYSIAALLLLIGLQSKTQNSSYIIGGTIGYGTSNSKFENTEPLSGINETTSLSGSPFGGYYISRKIMLGVAIDFIVESAGVSHNSVISPNYTETFIDPFVRYYFNSSLFIHGQVNFGKSFQEFDLGVLSINLTSTPVKLEYNVIGAGISVGYDVELSKKLKLEPMIRYIYNKYSETDYNFTRTSISLKMGLIYML